MSIFFRSSMCFRVPHLCSKIPKINNWSMDSGVHSVCFLGDFAIKTGWIPTLKLVWKCGTCSSILFMCNTFCCRLIYPQNYDVCPLLMKHKTCSINDGHLADLQKTLPTTDLNKTKLSFDFISSRLFFFPFFSICTCFPFIWSSQFHFFPFIFYFITDWLNLKARGLHSRWCGRWNNIMNN